MNDEDFWNEMRAIVNYAYGEDWIESENHLPHSVWESRYNDVVREWNFLVDWLAVNEPEVWHTLKPLMIEWAKEFIWGCDWMEDDVTQGFEEYKKQRIGCDD